ncbi:hypothetical protein Bpfe_006310, partial [Biomphalaria pfeifferi]
HSALLKAPPVLKQVWQKHRGLIMTTQKQTRAASFEKTDESLFNLLTILKMSLATSEQ